MRVRVRACVGASAITRLGELIPASRKQPEAVESGRWRSMFLGGWWRWWRWAAGCELQTPATALPGCHETRTRIVIVKTAPTKSGMRSFWVGLGWVGLDWLATNQPTNQPTRLSFLPSPRDGRCPCHPPTPTHTCHLLDPFAFPGCLRCWQQTAPDQTSLLRFKPLSSAPLSVNDNHRQLPG